jgi:Flp pilus assembly protein TadG
MPIGAAIGVGGSLIGGAIKSHQASKAANAQQAGAQQAQQTLERNQTQTRADLDPFRLQGQAAFQKLGTFMGLPSTGQVQQQNRVAANTGPDPRLGIPGYNSSTGVVGPTNQMGSTVMMRAPDGTTQQVPREQVQHYSQLGAQVVG